MQNPDWADIPDRKPLLLFDVLSIFAHALLKTGVTHQANATSVRALGHCCQ